MVMMCQAHRGRAEPGYTAPMEVTGHAFAAGWALNAFLFVLLMLAP